MERLTTKIDGIYWGDWDDIRIVQKLGKLEDVLEQYGIENLEEYIKSNQITIYAQNYKNTLEEENKRVNTVLDLIKQENNDLKQELAELKQGAIVPKFEPFQKIYVLIYNNEGKCSIVEHTYSGYSINYCARERVWIQCSDSDKSYMLSNCFATKEEAEKELKGE